MLKYNQKVADAVEIFRYFLSNSWEWEETTTHALHASMSEEDKKVPHKLIYEISLAKGKGKRGNMFFCMWLVTSQRKSFFTSNQLTFDFSEVSIELSNIAKIADIVKTKKRSGHFLGLRNSQKAIRKSGASQQIQSCF